MKKQLRTNHLSHAHNYVSKVGRSMTEMLGTLAIMGMLTIGAVSGIRYVMDKNTANAIMKEALTQASEIKVRRRQNIDTDGKIRYAYKGEYIKSREYSDSGKEIILKTGSNITAGVCEKLVGKDVSIFSSIESDKGSCEKYNTMIFTTDTTSFPSSKEFDACANETCCNHGTCVDGYCECDEGWMGARCCEQNCSGAINKPYCTTKEDEYDENGCKTIHYYPAPCGTDEYCDGGTGECKKCPEGQTPTSEGTTCGCSNGGNYFAEYKTCCPLGYTYVPAKNKCSKLDCPNGDGGVCKLDDQECGFNCTNTSDATAVTCSNGLCRANLCDEEKEIFSVRKKSIPGKYYYWGCQLKDTNCSRINDTVYCFNDDVEDQWYHCCIATEDGECEIGLCDINACPEGGEYYTIQDTTIYGGACLFEKADDDYDIVCRPKNTSQTVWDCYYETTGVQCATSCSAENPKDCCSGNDPCNGKGTYKDGGYCCFTNLSGQYVCMKNTYAYIGDDVCGSLCTASNYDKQTNGSYTASIKCNFGLCQDPEEGNQSCSSFGGEFEWIQYDDSDLSYSRYACVKDGLGCFNTTSGYAPYSCFLNKSSCGEACDDLAGNGCKIWHQKTCAPQITVDGITKPACTYSQPIWNEGDSEGAYIYDCHCQGDEVDYNGEKYCCPTGQVIQDGTCVVKQ